MRFIIQPAHIIYYSKLKLNIYVSICVHCGIVSVYCILCWGYLCCFVFVWKCSSNCYRLLLNRIDPYLFFVNIKWKKVQSGRILLMHLLRKKHNVWTAVWTNYRVCPPKNYRLHTETTSRLWGDNILSRHEMVTRNTGAAHIMTSHFLCGYGNPSPSLKQRFVWLAVGRLTETYSILNTVQNKYMGGHCLFEGLYLFCNL